jgi:CubicO group peptidase (beta-lactamase class C family)
MQGLGFRNWRIQTETGSKTVYGHTGFTGTAFGFIPKDDFAAVMLTNRLHASGSAVKTEDLWLPFLENSLTRR